MRRPGRCTTPPHGFRALSDRIGNDTALRTRSAAPSHSGTLRTNNLLTNAPSTFPGVLRRLPSDDDTPMRNMLPPWSRRCTAAPTLTGFLSPCTTGPRIDHRYTAASRGSGVRFLVLCGRCRTICTDLRLLRLSQHGYGILGSDVLDDATRQVISVFQSRDPPGDTRGEPDLWTASLLAGAPYRMDCVY